MDLRGKAVKAGLSVASGAYKTSLLSYFMHRDLFPSIMKVRSLHLKRDKQGFFLLEKSLALPFAKTSILLL